MKDYPRQCAGCNQDNHCKGGPGSEKCQCACVAKATLEYLISRAHLARADGVTCLLVGGKGQLVVESAGRHDVVILTEEGQKLFTLPGHHVAQPGDLLDIDLTTLEASFV